MGVGWKPAATVIVLVVVMISCADLDLITEEYHLQVTVDPEGAGIIKPARDTLIDEGVRVHLTGLGNEGFVFDHWSGEVDTTINPFTFIIRKDYSMVAHFVKKEYELQADTEGRGEVVERLVKAKTYKHGSIVEVNARPAKGFRFVRWEGDLQSPKNPETITMDGPKEITAVFEVRDSAAVIDLEVDWDNITDQAARLSYGGTRYAKAVTDSATHLGARMELGDNRHVQAGAARRTEEEAQRISFVLYEPGMARLKLSSVRSSQDSSENRAYLFGIRDSLNIQLGNRYRVAMSDISWKTATWRPVDSLAASYREGVFRRDRNDFEFEFWFLVNTPFQKEQDLPFDQLMVRVEARSGAEAGYRSGYREYFIRAQNPERGSANRSTHRFFPYLVGEKFDLPSQRYRVGETGEFDVIWE